MRTERKYKIIMAMAMLLSLLLLGTCIREPFRIRAAEQAQLEAYVLRGAALYATNCVQCHGPKGEGVVGTPLNRADLRVGTDSLQARPVYDMVYKAIAEGRPGNLNHPFWQRVDGNRWISYTAMPAWGRAAGGPADEEQVRALSLFLMQPVGDQWSLVGDSDLAPYEAARYPTDAAGLLSLPDANGLDAATQSTAQRVLRDRTRSQCLNCHMVGETGAQIGPGLSGLGSWGLDQAFVADWIRYANQPMHHDTDQRVITHEQRMPVFWSENRAVAAPSVDLSHRIASEGPYYMLRFAGRLTDAEIEALAQYLLAIP